MNSMASPIWAVVLLLLYPPFSERTKRFVGYTFATSVLSDALPAILSRQPCVYMLHRLYFRDIHALLAVVAPLLDESWFFSASPWNHIGASWLLFATHWASPALSWTPPGSSVLSWALLGRPNLWFVFQNFPMLSNDHLKNMSEFRPHMYLKYMYKT